MTEVHCGLGLPVCIRQAADPTAAAAVRLVDFAVLLEGSGIEFPSQAGDGPDQEAEMYGNSLDEPTAFPAPTVSRGFNSVPGIRDLVEPDGNICAATLFETDRAFVPEIPAKSAAVRFGEVPGPSERTGNNMFDHGRAVAGAEADAGVSCTRTGAPVTAGDVTMNHVRSVVSAEIKAEAEPVLAHGGDPTQPLNRAPAGGTSQAAAVKVTTVAQPEPQAVHTERGVHGGTAGISRGGASWPGVHHEAVGGHEAQTAGFTQSTLGTKAENAPANPERSLVEGQKAALNVSAQPADMSSAHPVPARGTKSSQHAAGTPNAPLEGSGRVIPSQAQPVGQVAANRGNAGTADTVPVQAIKKNASADALADAPRVEPTRIGQEVAQGLRHAGTLPVENQQHNGVGKVTVADLPGLLSQKIAHRLGSLEGQAGVVRLQFHLDPPELGSVAVRIALNGGELKIHFFANDVVAKEALTAAVPELRIELGRIGLDLGETSVSVDQEHGQGFGPQLHQWRTGFWFFEGDSSHPEAEIDEGINYLV